MNLIAPDVSVSRLMLALSLGGLDARYLNGNLVVRDRDDPGPRVPDDNITDLRQFMRRRAQPHKGAR